MTTDATVPATGRRHALLHRWPTLVGLLAAAGILLAGPDRTTVGLTVACAAVCYLAAAALDRPWAAWAAIPATGVVIRAGLLLGARPIVSLAVAAVVLVAIGVAIRVSRSTLTLETAGLLAYGGVAAVGLAIAPTAGLLVVAVTLVAHGAWDIWHLRRHAVVPGSLAEACIALDVPLGLGVLALLALT